jgi:hypothetical protein
MGDSDVEGGAAGDDGFHSPIGRKYRPVLANDRAVLEMSSIDPESSSSASSSVFPDQPPNLRYSRSSVFFMISVILIWFRNLKLNECDRILVIFVLGIEIE